MTNIHGKGQLSEEEKGGKQTADRRRIAGNSSGRRQALNTSQKTPN